MSIDMNTLISQMIMFFVILGCGFIGAKLGLLKAEVIHGLSSLLMGVICPLMLIAVFPSAVQEENAWDIAKSVIPYALITYPLLTGVGFLTGTLLHFRGDKRKIFTAQCLFGNMAFFGLPLVKEIFDPVAVVAFSFCIVIDNLFLWTEGVLLTSKSEGGQELSLKLIIKKLSNPVIVGVLIGLALMILKVPSDLLILRSFDTIGSCAKPLALLYIGGTIALMESGSLKKAWPVVFLIIIKLIVMPVVIFRVMTWLGVNDLARNIWTLIIALPSMASIPIMAESFGSTETDYAAQGVFIITLASLVTIPLVVMLCR